MSKIMTVRDVRLAKQAADDAMWARADAERAAWMPTDPRVGVLCRGGKPIYYAYVAGTYCESMKLKAVTSALAAQELPV